MKSANAIDPAPLNAHLLRLADVFRQFQSLLADQTRNVVQHNYDDMSQFTDRQAVLNEEMNTAEAEFVSTLKELTAKAGLYKVEPSVTTLEPYLADASVTRELRASLQESIKAARTQQIQLLQLLQFGQKNISDTLKAIHQLGNARDARYDHSGKLVEPERGRVVNHKG